MRRKIIKRVRPKEAKTTGAGFWKTAARTGSEDHPMKPPRPPPILHPAAAHPPGQTSIEKSIPASTPAEGARPRPDLPFMNIDQLWPATIARPDTETTAGPDSLIAEDEHRDQSFEAIEQSRSHTGRHSDATSEIARADIAGADSAQIHPAHDADQESKRHGPEQIRGSSRDQPNKRPVHKEPQGTS